MNITLSHPATSLEQSADTELMSAVARERSSKALDVLYRRHRPLLRSVISRVMNGENDADDVMQDVFMQVWEQAGNYSEDKGQVLGWLITLARRRALDQVRRNCSYKSATDRFELTVEAMTTERRESFDVQRAVAQNEVSQTIRTHLQLLPEPQREAVSMVFLEGLTQRELARRLSAPLGTVKTRIELGLKKLGRSLAPQRAA
jgi:RNA polymerase sigma-70 factor (ECF subfamily)